MRFGARHGSCWYTSRPRNDCTQALVFKVLGIAIALAAEIAPFSSDAPEKAIYYWADFYQVNRTELYETLKCESDNFAHDVIYGPRTGIYGEIGIAQIYRKYHPEVTKAQARDPDWAIRWIALQFSLGHEGWWVCHTKLLSRNT